MRDRRAAPRAHHLRMSRFSLPLSAEFLAVLERQGGAISADQAYACGHSADDIKRLRRAHVLTSVRRGVYALTDDLARLDDRERHVVETRAALLALDEPTTIGHESAAVWLGLEMLRPDLSTVHVVRPELRASRTEAGVLHHLAGLPAEHVVDLADRRVTSPARTGVDVARTTDLARGTALLDSVLRAGTRREEVLAVLDHCRAWPGARGASRAVTMADGRAANPGESWSRVLLASGGLPPDDLQRAVYDEDGLVGIVDFWYDDGLVGEFDGLTKYAVAPGAAGSAAASSVVREKLREDRLRSVDLEVVRWTWADLLSPERWLQRMRASLGRARSRRRPVVA